MLRELKFEHESVPGDDHVDGRDQEQDVPKRLLIYAMNFTPELIGCGRYTGEIASFMTESGSNVEVVTTPPHYPGWAARDGYSSSSYSTEIFDGVRISRCPISLSANMHGLARAWAPISFAISSAPVVFWRILVTRPSHVLCIEPTLFAAPAALLAAKIVGARTILHVQDLEIDAAFAVGHLKNRWVKKVALQFERQVTGAFDRVITISNKMRDKLIQKGVKSDKAAIVRNWVDISKVHPIEGPNEFRQELGIAHDDLVVLYAGNIGPKQALHLIIGAAEQIQDLPRVKFVIAGEGPAKQMLVEKNLHNVKFLPLQPEARLNALLNLADVHLLPQSAGVADLVLPSKIGGMLASGKEIIVMADRGTELYEFLGDSSFIIPQGDVRGLVTTLRELELGRTSPLNPRQRTAALSALSRESNLEQLLGLITTT